MLKARITGTGLYVPKKVLTNLDIENMVDTSDEWIRERTGIRERRIAAKEEAASDLALMASNEALKSAGLKARKLDLIVVATVTSDMPLPSTACILQHRIGAKKAAAFDVNAACSGFIYALSTADAYIRAGIYRRVLVVGSEVLSRITDWKDRSTCVLLGDGAGAVVLEATDGDRGILSVKLNADGSMWDLLHIPAGGSRMPATENTVKEGLHYMKMKGNETFKVAVRTLEKLVLSTLKEHKLKPEDISLLIPHQANLRIISATAKRLGLGLEKVMINLDRYGNTSAASIPIALDEAVRSGRIREGDYIILEAFGGGLTWASALIKW
ncbi:3-oxoacyl-[acyl-carrier-protein] synthase, KASIII [hydrothermal vent metagenome]|uniref:beta-ketoacyl-[acyl-carrier-protein] synthase III n=1 Tax=hydrothermal vent metagenome TaxID=652676 RepID=A0A3B1D0Q3_9ZZZZ